MRLTSHLILYGGCRLAQVNLVFLDPLEKIHTVPLLSFPVLTCLAHLSVFFPCSPLAVRPEEPASSRSNKRMTGFWDNFATKFQQAKQAQAAAAAAMAKGAGSEADVEAGIDNQGQSVDGENQEAAGGGEGEGGGSDAAAGGEDGDGGGGNSFSKYTSLGGGNGDTSLKWNFVTGKLAELKMKSMAKTN